MTSFILLLQIIMSKKVDTLLFGHTRKKYKARWKDGYLGTLQKRKGGLSRQVKGISE